MLSGSIDIRLRIVSRAVRLPRRSRFATRLRSDGHYSRFFAHRRRNEFSADRMFYEELNRFFIMKAIVRSHRTAFLAQLHSFL